MAALAASPLAGRISASLLGRHLPDYQGSLLDLLANVIKLLLALLLRTLLNCHRRHLDQRYRPTAKTPNAPSGDWVHSAPCRSSAELALRGQSECSGRGYGSSQGQIDWTLTARGPLSPAWAS